MKARRPFTFVTGDHLSPTMLNANFDRILQDLETNGRKANGYSAFQLEWTGPPDIDQTTTTENCTYRIKAPFAYDIVGVEFYFSSGTASLSATLSMSGAGADTWRNLGPLAATSATVRSKAVDNFVCRIPASTEIAFTVSFSGASPFTVETCRAVIHIRHTRMTYTAPSVTLVTGGDTNSASALNTNFTNIATAVTTDTNADTNCSILVCRAGSIAAAISAANQYIARIPSTARRMTSFDLIHTGAAGTTLTVTVRDDAGTTKGTATLAGSGSPPNKSQANAMAYSQSLTDPETPASDWDVQFTTGGAGTIPHGYAVIYFS